MQIIPFDKNSVTGTVKTLKKGGLVVFPSDTVYGLLCDANNNEAITRLLKFKSRPKGKPISVFVSDFSMMKQLVALSSSQEKTLQTLLPGPYTIVLPSKQNTSLLLESERKTLGVRIPLFQPLNSLMSVYKSPVTATSANISGQPPFYSISSFFKTVPQKKLRYLDLVVDAGALPKNKPSTVLDFSTSDIKTIRKGDLHFNSNRVFTSDSEMATKQYAQDLMSDLLKQKSAKPIVVILQGEMGVGKTIFAKGLGEAVAVTDIVSPTYVIYYEYKTKSRFIETFIHCDLYNVEEQEEFDHLALERYFQPGIFLCFEWGEKSGVLLNRLKQKADIVIVHIQYKGESKRSITIEQYVK